MITNEQQQQQHDRERVAQGHATEAHALANRADDFAEEFGDEVASSIAARSQAHSLAAVAIMVTGGILEITGTVTSE